MEKCTDYARYNYVPVSVPDNFPQILFKKNLELTILIDLHDCRIPIRARCLYDTEMRKR